MARDDQAAIVAKINKLLALADDARNSNSAERESAALEAVRLMRKHGVVAAPAPPEPEPARRPPRPRPQQYQQQPAAPVQAFPSGPDVSSWGLVRQMLAPGGGARCFHCGLPLVRGESVWYSTTRGFLHGDWPDWPCRS